uniref:uncharacterized protein LOC131129303 n=1 Tax=Doryrhamphus excisus TaxID=161450 RepID=UPI0025AE14D4|nr:uncharacterized protein LOC131129303 [Doryrhamphus excisus]
MRLILVKPTNATRRLDSTGQVFRDGDHELCSSSGPTPPTKSPDGMHGPYSGSLTDATSPTQEASRAPHETSNGVIPSSEVCDAMMSQLQTESMSLSQLSNQDRLLLRGQVSDEGGDSSGPNHNDACACSCPDSMASIFEPRSNHTCRSHKKNLSCQVFPHETNQDVSKVAQKRSQGSLMPQEAFKDSRSNLFNIPNMSANQRPDVTHHARYSHGDPAFIFKCRHLSSNHPTGTGTVKRSSTPALQSFSASRCSSLDRHGFAEEAARSRQSQVQEVSIGDLILFKS